MSNVLLLPAVVNDAAEKREEFWKSIQVIFDDCLHRPRSYVQDFKDSIGSIVQLPYKGEIIIVFNTEWHKVTKDVLYHEVKKEVGVSVLEGQLAKDFSEQIEHLKPAKEGYKRLIHFFCNSHQTICNCVYVPIGIDLGDTNLDPRPSFQYFPASTLRPVKDWQF